MGAFRDIFNDAMKHCSEQWKAQARTLRAEADRLGLQENSDRTLIVALRAGANSLELQARLMVQDVPKPPLD